MQSSSRSSSMDIFEVFSSRIKELQCKVEYEYTKNEVTENEKVRLAAIQLALHYDHLQSMIPSKPSGRERFSPTIITVEVQRVENCLQSFDSMRLHAVMFLMYLKVLHLLAKVNYDPLKNFSVAKHWLNTAERMYMDLLSEQNQHQNFYDCHELFSKSIILKPCSDGFATIDRLFSKNVKLLDEILQNESNEINHLIESYNTEQDISNWLAKLLSIIPKLLNESDFKLAAYFILIAQKVVGDDSKVHSSIATNWMHYFFGVFNQSKETLLKNFTPKNDEAATGRKGFSSLSNRSRKGNAAGSGSKSNFNCFSATIPLAQYELRLCVDSTENVDDARNLLAFSLDLVKKLIRDTESSHDPWDFIVHTYQTSDLLSISMILDDDSDECFNFQVQRFQYLLRMVKWCKKFYPSIFATLLTTFLADLNEVHLDLCATNYERILDLETGNDDKKQIQDSIQQKLTELQTLTAALSTNDEKKAI